MTVSAPLLGDCGKKPRKGTRHTGALQSPLNRTSAGDMPYKPISVLS